MPRNPGLVLSLLLALSGVGGLGASGGAITYVANREWRAADMSDIRVKPGSALDLGGLVEPGPAGRLGRLITRPDGSAVFAGAPGRPVRFFGFNMVCPQTFKALETGDADETRANLRAYAGLVRRQGYNLVRVHILDTYLMGDSNTDLVFNPARLDNFEYLFAELKKQGIYVYLDLAGFGLYFAGSWDEKVARRNMKAEMSARFPGTRANWREGVSNLLLRVNPHTGLNLLDDPAVVCVNFYNEQEHGYVNLKGAERPALLRLWRDWLKTRYGTVAKMAAAWRVTPDFASFADVPLGKPYDVDRKGNDYGAFLRDLDEENLAWYRGVVDELGYKGLHTQYDISAVFRYGVLRTAMPVVSMHGYHARGSLFTRPGAVCDKRSSVSDGAFYWRYMCGARLADRPFMVTEYNHGFWNEYQHEGGLVFGAYSALQDFQAVLVHENAVALDAKGPVHDYSVANSPVGRASEFLAALLYGRGDVAPARGRVELRLAPDYLKANWNRTANSEQTQLALVSRFGLRFADEKDKPSSENTVLALDPAEGAEVIGGDWTATAVASRRESFSLGDAVREMRRRGMIAEDNRTDPGAGVFQSDTGQLTMSIHERRLTVVTPRSEGVTLDPGASIGLGSLDVASVTVPAVVALCAVDEAPLAQSRRMVLVFSTQTVNTGMSLSADRGTMHAVGGAPALLRTGELKASLEHPRPDALQVWALAMDGTRRECIPAAAKNGRLEIAIDTAALEHGPTPFFEIAVVDGLE